MAILLEGKTSGHSESERDLDTDELSSLMEEAFGT